MLLKGRDLIPAIQEKQQLEATELAKKGITPRLAIIQAKDDPVIDTYVRMKRQYGAKIGAVVDIYKLPQPQVLPKLKQLNDDPKVHGIIIQLPMENMEAADKILSQVNPKKDVDGLGPKAIFEPATATAILNLLDGYQISLKDKKVVIVGRGRLVGAPLRKMLEEQDIDVEVVHSQTNNPEAVISKGDVVITATGKQGIITNSMITPGTVLVDGGTADDSGKTVGDLTADITSRGDIKVTPTPGGVGPLTVAALFENVLKAANSQQ